MNKQIEIDKVSLKSKLLRTIWILVSYLLFKPFVTNAFSWWRRIVLRMFGAKVSGNANIYASVDIWAPWNLEIEDGACIGPHVVCYNQAKIVIKRNVIVSQYSYLCTAGHKTELQNNAETGLIKSPIIIGEGAWIGARAFIGMGVCVGENAIVGANSGVYKDVEPGMIVGGNPAQIIKKRELIK